MKKFFLFFFAPTIAVLVIIVKVYEKNIESSFPQATNFIIGVLIIGTFYNSYLTVISPTKRLENSKKLRWQDMDKMAKVIIEAYKGSFNLSFNIMIPERKLRSQIEPDESDPKKVKYTWFSKVFNVVWSYGVHHVNSNLKFSTKQGCCGMSYRDEDFFSFDLEGMKLASSGTPAPIAPATPAASPAASPAPAPAPAPAPNPSPFFKQFNLNSEQIRLTDNLVMVASCPIVLTRTKAHARTYTVLGVLNVECRTSGSGILSSDAKQREKLFESMNTLADRFALNTEYYLPS